MFVYICYGGEMVKSNGLIEYKAGRVIIEIMNVHIPYFEFVSIVCDRLKVELTELKMYYTCKRSINVGTIRRRCRNEENV